MTTDPPRDRASAVRCGAWTVNAFGLEIEGSTDAPGLPPAARRGHGRPTRLEVVTPEEIDRDWPSETERVMQEHINGASPARTIDFHPELGYRLFARHFGLARISIDGSRVRCAPPPVAAWSWQRFLVGRVLPWAALLRGLEVFHASAVGLDGKAVGIIGPSGAGKTSLAVQLVLRGASFLTDDVMAVDQTSGVVRAHPGAAIASVRPAERAVIPEAQWEALGAMLGHSEKTYVEIPRAEGPLALGALYFLEFGRAEGQPVIAPLAAPDPLRLLSSTFVLAVRSPERLRAQLDICAELAAAVPMFTAAVEPGASSAELAAAVQEHAGSVLGA